LSPRPSETYHNPLTIRSKDIRKEPDNRKPDNRKPGSHNSCDASMRPLRPLQSAPQPLPQRELRSDHNNILDRSNGHNADERGRFLWPSPGDGAVTITPAQLGYLLEGIDWRMPQKTWRPETAG
jgi:hypothetical protein